MTTIVWFAKDLRIHDHGPLYEALETSKNVLPVYIHDQDPKDWPLGQGSQWWLQRSLKSLALSLETLGLNLVCEKGETLETLKKIGAQVGSKKLYFHKRYEPFWRAKQEKIEKILFKEGWEVKSFTGHLLTEPEEVKPYLVFTPYYKHILTRGIHPKLIPNPRKGASPKIPSKKFVSESAFKNNWTPGEQGALDRFKYFLKHGFGKYVENRDFPAIDGTSLLSPHLAFGEISPKLIWSEIKNKHDPFLRQIIWREFAYQMLWYHPHTDKQPLRQEYSKFPWSYNSELFNKWKEGRTGYPIVDAGMRQLAETGWMHNRVRMIVGSFLVKDLLIPWQQGAAYFWEKLVDADLANNTFGWQWVGGCGADAAPYFRVFNPTLQEEKFDPDGRYVKQWDPEKEKPIVDHQEAKVRALEAWQKIKK